MEREDSRGADYGEEREESTLRETTLGAKRISNGNYGEPGLGAQNKQLWAVLWGREGVWASLPARAGIEDCFYVLEYLYAFSSSPAAKD